MLMQVSTRSMLLPRLAGLCKPPTPSLNTIGRVGIRQASSTPWLTAPAKRIQVKSTRSVSLAIVGLGLGGIAFSFPKPMVLHCDSEYWAAPHVASADHSEFVALESPKPVHKDIYADLPPPPQSAISLYELGFGTCAGLCAGIFVKKGAKAAAWLLGGVFVLLQVSNMIATD